MFAYVHSLDLVGDIADLSRLVRVSLYVQP